MGLFKIVVICLVSLLANFARAEEETPFANTRLYSADENAIREDLELILKQANLPKASIRLKLGTVSVSSTVKINCKNEDGSLELEVRAPSQEWSSSFYYGLQKMGFLFPHPRIQISPTIETMRVSCDKTYEWRPRFNYRGFHLHTMHPSEWAHGFLMGEKDVARDTLRWLARNQQNVVQVVLLAMKTEQAVADLNDTIVFAHEMGISFGIDVSFSLQQQHAYRLVKGGILNKIAELFGASEKILRHSVNDLANNLPFDFMTVELGSSEFSDTDPSNTLEWLNTAQKELAKYNKTMFVKVHCSIDQNIKGYGNFNYLPQYANKNVGILPHTVMDFALRDASAPVYGRKDFSDMTVFLKSQLGKRQIWYYPETSFFVGADIDIPIFLTDYLVARSEDMDDIEAYGLNGHLNFSTGQELGYWFFDWTVALLNNSEYRGDPLIAAKLLGENMEAWNPILAYQTKYFKNQALLEEISSANLGDELGIGGNTLARTVFNSLKEKPELLKKRIEVLTHAVADAPSLDGIKNPELKAQLEITWLRVQHALHLRKALLIVAEKRHHEKAAILAELNQAQAIRLQAQAIMNRVMANYNRYPEAKIFERNENITSYPFGYGWTAGDLHFWKREEEMIRQNDYHWFFMNIYAILRILKF